MFQLIKSDLPQMEPGIYGASDLTWETARLWPARFYDTPDPERKEHDNDPAGRCIEDAEAGTIYLNMADGTGKVTDCGYDQIACMYTKIPSDTDLTFSAKILVDSFQETGEPTFQESFGIFLRDTMDNDSETGYPYSNMAAVGGYYGGCNLFGRTGITKESIADARNFFLYGMRQEEDLLRIGKSTPRLFKLTISRSDYGIHVDMTDERGRHLFAAEKTQYCSDAGMEVSPDNKKEGGILRISKEVFQNRDREYLYLGFMAARCGVKVLKDSIYIKVHERRENDTPEQLWVSPGGTCTGNGSRSFPLDLQTAIQVCGEGQEICLTPGRYLQKNNIIIRKKDSPEEGKRRKIRCINNQDTGKAVIDFADGPYAFLVCGDHWDVEDIAVTGGMGIQISGNDNHLRRCISCRNLETGILIRHPQNDSPEFVWPSDNLIEECISYCNRDLSEHNADGFACKVAAGEGNRFVRCLSFLNSDDGFDLFAKNRKTGAVVLQECRSIMNGYVLTKKGTIRQSAGNGNGFKLGGSGQAVEHKVIDCEAVGNRKNGFTSNSNPYMYLSGCTSKDNGKNIEYYFSGRQAKNRKVIENCKDEREPVFDPELWAKQNLKKEMTI